MADTWLVAHDFSPCSHAAGAEAARLLEPLGGHLHLLHVHAPPSTSDSAHEMERELRRRLDAFAIYLRDRHPRLDISVGIGFGDPVQTILDEAERLKVDHIVVGTHGKSGLELGTVGSVALQVEKLSPVPVLIVRNQRNHAGQHPERLREGP